MKNRLTAYMTLGDADFWVALSKAGVDGASLDDAMERAIDQLDDFELEQMMGGFDHDN